MIRAFILFTLIVISCRSTQAQIAKLTCTEKEVKNEDGIDPILVQTCLLKQFKFIVTSHPDYAGRYFSSEQQVFKKVKGKYIEIKNSQVFNDRQAYLVSLINKQIELDFHALKNDTTTKDCLSGLDSIPRYTMDELEISFRENKIWFSVEWGIGGACRAFNGTTVSYRVEEIRKYLN